jgi:hypothetical protein
MKDSSFFMRLDTCSPSTASAFNPNTSWPCAFVPRTNGALVVVGLKVCTAVMVLGSFFNTKDEIGSPPNVSALRSADVAVIVMLYKWVKPVSSIRTLK